jgi:hypothetical protein
MPFSIEKIKKHFSTFYGVERREEKAFPYKKVPRSAFYMRGVDL